MLVTLLVLSGLGTAVAAAAEPEHFVFSDTGTFGFDTAQARAEATTSTVVLHGLTRSDFNADICGRLATFTFTVRTQVIHLIEHEDGTECRSSNGLAMSTSKRRIAVVMGLAATVAISALIRVTREESRRRRLSSPSRGH